MRNGRVMVMVSLVNLMLLQVFSPIASGADTSPTPFVSPTGAPVSQVSPPSSGVLSPTSPPIAVTTTPTPVPKHTVASVRQVTTPTPFPLPTVTPTPPPRFLITPTPKPKIVALPIATPSPTPSMTNSIITFPKNLLSYIAPRDPYETTSLSARMSLEFLSLGCALVAVGMLVLRWKEGDRRVMVGLKQIGVALRSWLL